MHRIRSGFLLLLLLLVLAGTPAPVHAQSYSFEVPVQEVIAAIDSDGVLTLDYWITFSNQPGASPIDIIDIGMPNYDYDLGSVTATIDDAPVAKIADSTYVSPGIEVHLGANEIQPGQTGTVHVHIGTVRNALGLGTEEEAEPYASLVFTPSWFDSSIVEGSTQYTFSIILPPGVEPEQPRYHTPSGNWPGADEPSVYYNTDDRVVYTWTSDKADADTEYRFGASFPMALVPSAVVVATETPNSRSFDLESIIPCLCFGGIMAAIIGVGVLGAKSAQKRKMQYMPPKISVEGHGIKRGLTAVEAAILMEQPLDNVLTMVLFSVLKKEAARIVTRDPLQLEVTKPLPDNLQPYEIDFCKAFETEKKAERRTALQNVTVGLVKSVSEKMKGFSRKETIEYYTAIMEKAWQQVTEADTPEVKSETYEQVMDWTMLDKEWQGRTKQTFGPQPVIVPTWWWRFDPGMGTSTAGGGGLAKPAMPSTTFAPGGGSVTLPKLPGSDFAASMVTGVENFSNSVIGDLNSFTDSITNRTNPVPKTTYTGSGRTGGSSGRSCACACACAGCACACAGGGR